MTPLNEFPELPEKPQKHEYVNAQFDAEAPHSLSGVMGRWVAPEGYTGEEEILIAEMVVPRLEVTLADEEEEPDEEEPIESREMAQVYKYPAFVFWFLGGGLVLMVILNIILLLRK